MPISLGEISTLFLCAGSTRYGGEAVTQLQHALQCAQLAELAGASPELVSAALLHDLGHLLVLDDSSHLADKVAVTNDTHQYAAIPFLRGMFPDAVLEPMRLHVEAKRYLCFTHSSYWGSLSPASKRSLELQGGIFSKDEALAFAAMPFAGDAVALRRWDDLAKNPDVVSPKWPHYVKVLQSAAIGQPFTA